MKSLHVETGRHLYGGPQQVLYLLEGLTRRGHETVLVCPPGSEIAAAAGKQGLRTLEIPCSGDHDLRFAWRLRQVLMEESPAIVHCHSRRGADFLGGRAAAMAGIPAVVSRRVDNPDPKFVAKLRYRNFRRVIAISGAIEQELLRSGVDPARVVLIHSVVDLDRFRTPPDREALCQEFSLPPDAPLIVSAAQMIPRKGQRYLLEAIAQVRETHPNVRVLLFGRGPEEQALRALAQDLDLGESAVFPGFRDDLDDWLGGFDLLVHTALTEGLGVIALKARAAGLPVIAFAAGGLPEVIAHKENGILVTPGDVDGLAAEIRHLLDDSDTRASYAAAARRDTEERFSIDGMVDAHIALYRDVAHGT